MQNFKIVSNVELPVRSVFPKLPLEDMEKGDSFFIEMDVKGKSVQMLRQRVARFQRNNPQGAKFSVIRENNKGMRVFRIQ